MQRRPDGVARTALALERICCSSCHILLVSTLLLLVYPLFVGHRGSSLHKADLFGGRRLRRLRELRAAASRRPGVPRTVGNTFYFVLLTVPALDGDRPWPGARAQPTDADAPRCCARVLLLLGAVGHHRHAALAHGVHPRRRLRLDRARGSSARQPVAFLSDEELALPAIAITTIWWCIGLPMMLFLAALQQVPRELYEAAALDNAGRWRTLWHVTLPSIRRTFVAGHHHRDHAAVPAVRSGATDDARRPEQRVAADRAVHLRGRLQSLGHRLCRRGRADAVRDDPRSRRWRSTAFASPPGGAHEHAAQPASSVARSAIALCSPPIVLARRHAGADAVGAGSVASRPTPS